MFLKSLEMFGFKSFADRARIEFTPGITALLGPNGCGKSNVVDALKWVLGEQASKSLRADKMEDVIFNGTEGRKAVNVAEVTLTLGNEEGHLALDLPEVAVKRRLFRNGESEYFINNAPVKLKDLRELFFDTGVGKSAYSVMEQGRIDQILSTKPEERRYLFEEAAGITKFRVRGQEAERRLEKTEENLRQLEAVLSEIHRSWETLKRQSEKTGRYRGLRQEIFRLEKSLVIDRLQSFHRTKERVQSKIKSHADQQTEVEAAWKLLNQTMEADLEAASTMEADLVRLQAQLHQNDLERSDLSHRSNLILERLRQLDEETARFDLQEKALAEKQLAFEQDLREKTAVSVGLDDQLAACRTNLAEFDEAVGTARHRIGQQEQQKADLQQELDRLEREDQNLQAKLREMTDKLVQDLDDRLKNDGVAWHKLPQLHEDMERHLQSVKILLNGRKNLLADTLNSNKPASVDFLRTLHSSLEESLKELSGFEEGWKTYRQAVPSFLEEFLSPQGMITQRRQVEETWSALREAIRTTREAIRTLSEDNLRLAEQVEGYRKRLEELRMAEVRMQTQRDAEQEAIERLQKELQDLGRQAEGLQTGRKDLTVRRQDEDRRRAEVEGLRQENSQRELELRSTKKTAEDTLGERNRSLVLRKEMLRNAAEDLTRQQKIAEGLQIEAAEVGAQIQALYENFRDKHSVDLHEFQDEIDRPTEQSAEQLRENLSLQKEELRELGQVNLMAVEEFAELDERHTFLQGQCEDLKKAREDLRQVTAEIKRESAVLFRQTFDRIRENFHESFRRLFGGGRAELRLTDPENVLESGIEMLCQPPGKKLESINLLSGGEKSMTAVALLFATFQVKPSPFCILDEIDAALDESNVGRFLGMLAEFAASSQFVVITHNKRTVAGASTMIGVTMETAGISKVVAIRLSVGEPS